MPIPLNLREHPRHLQVAFHGWENYVDSKKMSDEHFKNNYPGTHFLWKKVLSTNIYGKI